jgi:hypothetical protein
MVSIMMLGLSAAGVANIISILALLLAAYALFRQVQATGRLAALEQERHEMAKADRGSAKVSVRLIHTKNRTAWELAVANRGPAPARNIDLSAKALKAPELSLRLINEGNLPIGVLQAGGELSLPAVGGWEVGPPYEITLSWDDDRPGRQLETHTITDEQGVDYPPFEG